MFNPIGNFRSPPPPPPTTTTTTLQKIPSQRPLTPSMQYTAPPVFLSPPPPPPPPPPPTTTSVSLSTASVSISSLSKPSLSTPPPSVVLLSTPPPALPTQRTCVTTPDQTFPPSMQIPPPSQRNTQYNTAGLPSKSTSVVSENIISNPSFPSSLNFYKEHLPPTYNKTYKQFNQHSVLSPQLYSPTTHSLSASHPLPPPPPPPSSSSSTSSSSSSSLSLSSSQRPHNPLSLPPPRPRPARSARPPLPPLPPLPPQRPQPTISLPPPRLRLPPPLPPQQFALQCQQQLIKIPINELILKAPPPCGVRVTPMPVPIIRGKVSLSKKILTSSTNNSLQYQYNGRSKYIYINPQRSYVTDDTPRNQTERDRLLTKWRSNYCETSEDITEKLAELATESDKILWIRSSPADIYYKRLNENIVESTSRLDSLCTLFETVLIERGAKIRATQKQCESSPRIRKQKLCRHKTDGCDSSDESDGHDEEEFSMEELTKKIQHPYRLHPDIWHNEPGEMNDGPLCRCSKKSRRSGIRHNIYPGETGYPKCTPNSNNADKLYHYRITISPPTNFLTKTPTIIKHDQHEFIFEGFSLLSHKKIGELPTCKVIRFNIEYAILYVEEKLPENFTIKELDLFHNYLFIEILELLDFNLRPSITDENSCSCFHFFPRFVRDLPDYGKEVLSMSEVLKYLLDSSGPLVSQKSLKDMLRVEQTEWQNYVDDVRDMVVTNPGMKPCSIRVDQLDRNVADLPECIDPDDRCLIHPIIVHFGIKPPQLSYVGNPEYQRVWRDYVKFRHLIANMSKPSYDDKRKLEFKENHLQDMRALGRMKRNITVAVSSRGFYRTGIMCDIVQHAMLIPVLTTHLRFHQAIDELENIIDYKFKSRYLLQLALTHPSYKETFGTNPDHARNSLTNCGIRQPEYGDRKIHYMNLRKRGINTLINIMSRFGKENETDSNISHNERLEFLGDAVIEFLSSIHLFFMFPGLEEGGLATYRAAIVQNQHLAVLAKKLRLDEFMLYAHGSDLCHELELRHAMANCFEALMGALLLDSGIDVAGRVFAFSLFQEDPKLKDLWENYPPHPLQEQEPLGDRHFIESHPLLKDLTEFEDSIGVKFRHIRLLARAFTDRSIGYTHLTLGSNQRLEFLGDTVLQLICSEYLYRHFPEHHEGHLSLLRSSLVNNRTESVVCDDLGMTKYANYANPKAELKTKDRADLLEAFLGALYVDRGLQYCTTFCQVCLFPRLQIFIMNQDWNDPKSKLQQCCLTLRSLNGGEPDIPIYKIIECTGPTNTRVYTVAVYFRGKRLASSTGHSIQQAEMNAAKSALENSSELFPQLDHQRRVITKSIIRQKGYSAVYNNLNKCNKPNNFGNNGSNNNKDYFDDDNESNLPKQYRTREDISSDELDFLSDYNDDTCAPFNVDNVSESTSVSATPVTATTPKRKHKRKKKRKLKKNKSSENKKQRLMNPVDTSDVIDDGINNYYDECHDYNNHDADLSSYTSGISTRRSGFLMDASDIASYCDNSSDSFADVNVYEDKDMRDNEEIFNSIRKEIENTKGIVSDNESLESGEIK